MLEKTGILEELAWEKRSGFCNIIKADVPMTQTPDMCKKVEVRIDRMFDPYKHENEIHQMDVTVT